MTVADRLTEVRSRIARACHAAGRSPDSVRLIAVSKTVPVERCAEALTAGQQLFGENYAQELRDKARALPSARWHFIGPLQRNKVKYVVGTAALVHTVDSEPLLIALGERASAHGVSQACLIQVNVGEEPQKAGCSEEALSRLLEAAHRYPSLTIQGLMCIPPAESDPRPHFRRLAALGRSLRLSELSMGMSADYEVAIAEGATLVRVGTAIFGARDG